MKVFGAIAGLLFGLVFAGAGVMIMGETAIPAFDSWQAMKSWQPTTAALTSVSGTDTGTEATYRYSVNGVQYLNDRVSVSEFKDNIGSYQKDMRTRLENLERTGQPVRIWYDPDDPQNSVIDRDMRWGLFVLMTAFCSVFIIIGLTVCYFSIHTSAKKAKFVKPPISEIKREWRQKKDTPGFNTGFFEYYRYRVHELRKQAEAHPGIDNYRPEPWLERKQWQTSRIRSDAKSGVIAIWAFAVIWNAISSPVLFAFMDEWKKGNHAILVGLLFPLVGLFLIYKAVQSTSEWRRFGIVEFDMDPFPGSIGGHVGGTIEVKNLYEYDAEYKVELECVYSYVSGSGDNRSRSEDIRWAESGTARVEAAASGIRLSFRFDIPEELPESDVEQSDNYYFWRFTVKSDLPGVDLDRSYNIPVFKTRQQSRHVRHDISSQVVEARSQKAAQTEAALARGDLHATDLARSLRFSETAKEARIYFPMFRNRMLTVVCMIFGGGFSFAAIMMTNAINGFEVNGLFDILKFIFAVPFAVIGLLAGVAAIYLPLNNLSVTISTEKITVLRRLFLFPIIYKKLNAGDISSLQVRSTGSTGKGTKKIEHFKVIANTYDRKKITIAEDIDGKDLAEQFREFISNRTGIA